MSSVSVIMNCFNSSKYLREAIDSVYAQTYQDWEIIFWDNASTDESPQIAKSYNGKLKYFRSGKTVTLGQARKWAVEKAQGKYFAILDCDDLWLPEKLEKQIAIFETNPEVGLVYSDCYIINSSGQVLERIFSKHIPHRGKILADLFLDNFISCLTAVIRKSVFDRVGYFDPKFSISEEYDLFCRISEIYEIDFIDLPLAKYRIAENSLSKNRIRAYEEEKDVVEGIIKANPGLKKILGDKIIKKRLSVLYFNLGKAYFFHNDKQKSIFWFNKSMKLNKSFFNILISPALVFIGPRLAAYLRKYWRKFMKMPDRGD